MNKQSKRTVLIAWLAGISLFFYFIYRIYMYSSLSLGLVNALFAFFLLLAEAHSILQSLGFISRIINLKKISENWYHHAPLDLNNLPEVTILVPARNEPLKILETTFICLTSINYQNKKLYFLDGSDPEFQEQNASLAQKYGFYHFVPKQPSKNKAEIINKILPQINSKYVSVFDADQNPMPTFLLEVVALIEYSQKIAFIQTPQLYTNITASPVAKGSALQQSIFFENICEGKGATNSMFCCGTNFIMRTDILKEVGGFDEKSITEDFSTSIKIHSLGYKSIYYKHVRVFGMAPETLSAYFKQQYRWAGGTVGVIRKLVPLIIQGKIKLTLSQSWEYLLSATYYFTGWSFFVLVMSPALYLLFGVPSYFANPYFYLITFIPYYILTLTTFYATMKKRHYKVRDVFVGTMMSSISFPILMQATLSGLFNKKMAFKITDKGRGKKMPWIALWPWIIMVAINIAALINGILRYSENHYAIGINMFWCFYHLILISSIFRLNKIPKLYEKE